MPACGAQSYAPLLRPLRQAQWPGTELSHRALSLSKCRVTSVYNINSSLQQEWLWNDRYL